MTRRRALVEALVVLASVVPAIFLISFSSNALGVYSPALPPLGILVSVGVATLFLRRTGGGNWRGLGFTRPKSIPFSIAMGVLGTIIGFLLFNIMVGVTRKFGLPGPDISGLSDVLNGNLANYIQFMVLVVWGSAAIGEELFARGFLLNRMEVFFAGLPGAWVLAAIAQALAFGMLHFYQGLTGILGTALIGFMMALLYRFTGRNLVAPIVAHGLIDTYGITALYLGVVPV